MRVVLAILAAAVAVIGGCVSTTTPPGPSASGSTSPSPSAATPARLADTQWRLVAIDAAPVPPGPDITLGFSGGRTSGVGPCNGFGGTIEYIEATGSLRILDLVSTKRACVDPVRTQLESRYFEALRSVTLAMAAADGGLILSGPGAELMFAPAVLRDAALPADLARQAFVVVWLDGRVPGRAPTMTFTETEVTGSTSCNQYTGLYRYEQLTGSVKLFGVSQTEMACIDLAAPDGLRGPNATERLFRDALGLVDHASSDDLGRLVLSGPEGPLIVLASARS